MLPRSIVLFLLASSGLFFAYRRSLRYLQILQQDEYAPDRFFEWYKFRKAFDRKGSLLCLLIGLVSFLPLPPLQWYVVQILAGIGLASLALREEDARKHGKVKLVLTPRAHRIWILAFGMYTLALCLVLLFVGTGSLGFFWMLQLVLFQLLPFSLTTSVKALQPLEDSIQKKYFSEASAKVRALSPFIIGITGSYGKTSTKNALGEILQVCLGPTFWPKGSINTLMGNTREIRNNLFPGHRFAVIEMAAYREGSISTACTLCPPAAGIITGIGDEHLERFGTRDAIYRAKTELVRAIPRDGILVVNGDDDLCRRVSAEFAKNKIFLFGLTSLEGLHCKISEISFGATGTSFSLEWLGRKYQGSTRLLGRPALYNCAAVFTMACALGAQPMFVLSAIANLEPVKNRLSLEKAGKVIRLNDAYNSNPVGFKAALEVLREYPGSRKILMTPGMVELGPKQFQENERMGKIAASVCSDVILVGETNRKALKKGLLEGGMELSQVKECPNRASAFSELTRIEGEGSVTLIENDLTDWYESRSTF